MAKRPILRLKRDELVPPDDDRQVEIGIYDLLLPCRRFDIAYKVAVLGVATPTLEFLLRLAKAVPGVSEEEVLTFFGFSRRELEYVLEEATGPGYVERDEGRLWLTTAGDELFSNSDDGPMIFGVEGRKGSYGFDLLSMAPEKHRALDRIEMALPDLKLEHYSAVSRASQDRIPESFRRFFRELGDRKDREQVKKLDLYSIDSVVPGDRFQVPVRVRILAQASSPHIGEIDLSSWRPDYEIYDRPEIEQAAGRFLTTLETSANPTTTPLAYQTLVDLAPDFLKEFTTKSGLSVNRYWREAVSRAGELRSDRKTVPLVGALVCPDNIERLLRAIEYGQENIKDAPPFVLSIPPQVSYWGATSVLKDTLAALWKRLLTDNSSDENNARSLCVVPGKPPKFLERTFDQVATIDRIDHARELEFLIIPNIAACVLVHAPIGVSTGLAAPLGLASFDPDVLARLQSFLADSAVRYVADQRLRSVLERGLKSAQQFMGQH